MHTVIIDSYGKFIVFNTRKSGVCVSDIAGVLMPFGDKLKYVHTDGDACSN